MQRSSNSSWTNRRIRDVLPTAASPTRQTFVLIRWASGIGGIVPFASDYLKGPPGGHLGGTFLSAPLFGTAMRLDRRLILALDLVDPATRPERVKALRAIIGSRLILSPGVGAQGGNAREAIAAGADAVIVGRAIYEAADPITAAQGVANEIRSVAPR